MRVQTLKENSQDLHLSPLHQHACNVSRTSMRGEGNVLVVNDYLCNQPVSCVHEAETDFIWPYHRGWVPSSIRTDLHLERIWRCRSGREISSTIPSSVDPRTPAISTPTSIRKTIRATQTPSRIPEPTTSRTPALHSIRLGNFMRPFPDFLVDSGAKNIHSHDSKVPRRVPLLRYFPCPKRPRGQPSLSWTGDEQSTGSYARWRHS